MGALTLPAGLEHLREALDFVEVRARETGLEEKRILEIELALEEVLANVFTYAYPDGGGIVEIRCFPEGKGRLGVEVRDRGIPFDCLSRKDPDLKMGLDDRPIGGLGIFFFKRLASRVEYRREEGTNILSLLF